MSDFLKNPLSSGSSADATARKEALMNQVRSELALTNAQELINKMNEKCFLKCVTKPSTSLSSSEETCLTRCMERYMQAFDIISKSYTARLSRESLEPRL
ncbi:hypothetical protein BD410DRAFT_784446 [Rickenella mellea]|uniref:Mitochondrial import inner membrane translocase subunit n=1 Tax=Rickenella mellea TaxID=50990 RepID=A0A4Y7QCP2_9AGAM|nr:hypothetical protein BD410DRAFT_784446 [Rickenella mellea]